MSTGTASPTIVLIHGLFVTPLSWERWIQCYSAEGYDVISPAWPGMDGGIEQLRANTNTLNDEGPLKAYERYAISGPGRPLFQATLAKVNPHATTTVDFHNDERAPLLRIAGGKDHTAPAAVSRANAKPQCKSRAIMSFKESPERPHFTLGVDGWEEAADYVLHWALNPAPSIEVL